jgi:t-SNARE complex subunit (syntaxin)
MEALTMETPMTEWNNDRLDEMNGRMKEGFAEVDKRFAEVDKRFAEVDKRFDKVDERFDKVDERFVRLEVEMRAGFAHADQRLNAALDQITARIDRLYYAIIVAAVGVIGTFLVNAIGS